MGGLGFVDPSLLNLADELDAGRGPIYRMAMLQHSVNLATGHILALNDAYVRMRIRKSALVGEMPVCNVRCVACTAVASLDDWARCAVMDEDKRFRVWETMRQAMGEVPAQFLHACEGGHRATHLLEALAAMTEGDWL